MLRHSTSRIARPRGEARRHARARMTPPLTPPAVRPGPPALPEGLVVPRPPRPRTVAAPPRRRGRSPRRDAADAQRRRRRRSWPPSSVSSSRSSSPSPTGRPSTRASTSPRAGGRSRARGAPTATSAGSPARSSGPRWRGSATPWTASPEPAWSRRSSSRSRSSGPGAPPRRSSARGPGSAPPRWEPSRGRCWRSGTWPSSTRPPRRGLGVALWSVAELWRRDHRGVARGGRRAPTPSPCSASTRWRSAASRSLLLLVALRGRRARDGPRALRGGHHGRAGHVLPDRARRSSPGSWAGGRRTTRASG